MLREADRAIWRVPAVYTFFAIHARARGPGRGLTVAYLRGRSPTPAARLKPPLVSGVLSPWRVAAEPSGAAKAENKAIANQSPLRRLSLESDSKERLRVSNWIVQRLYNDAVKKTVKL